MACSRLGDMLHLDTQKGKDAMKILTFFKDIGGTEACMKRLMMAKKIMYN